MSPEKFQFSAISACPMCESGRERFIYMGHRLSRSQGFFPVRRQGDVKIDIKKCGACGLIFPDPMPLPPSPEMLYDVPAEEYWKKAQLQPAEGYFQGELSTLRKYLGNTSGKKALDIGSGMGFAASLMAGAGMDVRGIEPSASFSELSVRRDPGLADRITRATADTWEFPGMPFDFINFGAVLEHLPDPAGSLDRAVRHLSETGVIHIEVPHANWLVSRIARLQFRMRGTRWVMNLSPMHRPFHLYEFTPLSFRKYAASRGLRVRELHVFNTNSYLHPFIDFLIRPVMELTSTGIGLKVWISR
ncbi:MAG: class I SAM-dependent methyltransferase [Bacteroidia bacterium]|nr:class I SAM-dependent methyltransferase [Bacteroidia bacterium]